MDKVTQFFTEYRNPIYITGAILLIIVIIYLVMRRSRPTPPYVIYPPYPPQPQSAEQFEGQADPNEQKEHIKVILFFAPWCPHCKKLMNGENSIWEQLKRKYSGHHAMSFDQINCDDKPDVANKFAVDKYPTIMKLKGDKSEVFEGEPTVESIESFIQG